MMNGIIVVSTILILSNILGGSDSLNKLDDETTYNRLVEIIQQNDGLLNNEITTLVDDCIIKVDPSISKTLTCNLNIAGDIFFDLNDEDLVIDDSTKIEINLGKVIFANGCLIVKSLSGIKIANEQACIEFENLSVYFEGNKNHILSQGSLKISKRVNFSTEKTGSFMINSNGQIYIANCAMLYLDCAKIILGPHARMFLKDESSTLIMDNSQIINNNPSPNFNSGKIVISSNSSFDNDPCIKDTIWDFTKIPCYLLKSTTLKILTPIKK